jgi:hypothetical protein
MQSFGQRRKRFESPLGANVARDAAGAQDVRERAALAAAHAWGAASGEPFR